MVWLGIQVGARTFGLERKGVAVKKLLVIFLTIGFVPHFAFAQEAFEDDMDLLADGIRQKIEERTHCEIKSERITFENSTHSKSGKKTKTANTDGDKEIYSVQYTKQCNADPVVRKMKVTWKTEQKEGLCFNQVYLDNTADLQETQSTCSLYIYLQLSNLTMANHWISWSTDKAAKESSWSQ